MVQILEAREREREREIQKIKPDYKTFFGAILYPFFQSTQPKNFFSTPFTFIKTNLLLCLFHTLFQQYLFTLSGVTF
jgi:hypothetical protein